MRIQSFRSCVLAIALLAAACGGRRDTAAPPSAPSPAGHSERGTARGHRENVARRGPLRVFAAASLRDALAEIGPAFTAHGRPPVEFNFAGSNILAQQLVASDRGDVFLSADEGWVGHLEVHQRAEPGTKRWFLSNTLVVVAHPSTTFTLASIGELDHLPFEHLSIADPVSVPAGHYAKAYLESVHVGSATLWSRVAPRVAPAADVRAALAVVAADARSVGIVYRTDARTANVRTLLEVPPADLPEPVRYYAVVVAGRPRLPLSTAFVEFLGSSEARAIFERHGFLMPPSP